MKIKSILLVGLLVLITLGLRAQQKEDFTIRFVTLGNCYLCKLRVEAKVNSVEGVITSNYDPSKDETTVTYDDFVTDSYIIMQAVADTGHDTEWYAAPDEAYEMLIGTCCEYERTIDYSQVQIGYLSLMDMWMGHVMVHELKTSYNFAVYPNIGNGKFEVNFNDVQLYVHPKYRVYNTNGILVFSGELTKRTEQLDLSFLSGGTYIIQFYNNNRVISSSKIVKL